MSYRVVVMFLALLLGGCLEGTKPSPLTRTTAPAVTVPEATTTGSEKGK